MCEPGSGRAEGKSEAAALPDPAIYPDMAALGFNEFLGDG